MNLFNILSNESIVFQFPTIFEYSYAQTHSKRLSQCGQYFSKNKVFINNGDTFNGKYIIKYFKKTTNDNEIININNDNSVNIPSTLLLNKVKDNFYNTELHKIINEEQDLTLLTENIHIMSSIGLLTKKQYQEFLDKPSNTMKINYLKNTFIQRGMFYKPHLMPLQQPTKFKKIIQDHKKLKIITYLLNEQVSKSCEHLKNCEVIEKNKILTKLMQCGVTIFDITNGSEIELEQARFSFNYIYNELINYSDEEITRSKKKGIIRKFILISTAMTWAKDTCNYQNYDENEEVINTSFTEKDVLERLPIAKYQIIFEFEKLLLKSNSSKIKDIFQTYIIGTGIIYGHEENALRYVFTSAWHNPKEMYISMLNRRVPVFHVDELVKLVFIVSTYDHVKNNYILAVEQESYGFNNIIRSICDELCSSRLVLKEDHLIINHYKFNSFTWDLISSDLNIDSMLDIIVPNYQVLQTSIISNMKKWTLDFIEANNLYSLKILVSAQPTHILSNIMNRLAKYYQVQLIDIPTLINNYFTSLKNDLTELELRMNDLYIKRTNIKHTLVKLTAQFDEWFEQINEQLNVDNYSLNEQNDNEITLDTKQNLEFVNNNIQMLENDTSENTLMLSNLSYDNYFKEHDNYKLFTKNKTDLLENDTEINNIKSKLKHLNAKYKEYENNFNRNKGLLDSYYLLPLIKELLSSFSCRNQGYILHMFPLCVEQIKFIFNKDISYPNAIILLSYNHLKTDIQKCCDDTCLTVNENNKICLNHNNLEQDTAIASNSFVSETSDIYDKQEVSITGTNMQDRNITKSILMNNKQKYESTSINHLEDYSKNKGIIVHRLNIPLELADKTISYNLQHKFYTDTIISLIGRSPFKDIRHETDTNGSQISPNKELSITRRINRKLQITLNKLNIMKEQWKKDINKTLKSEKKQEHRNSVKIHNFLSTNILPKLLKEVSPVYNGSSHFPEKTINKTILCNTQTDEKY